MGTKLTLSDYGEWLLANGHNVTVDGQSNVGVGEYTGPPLEYENGVLVASLIPFGQVGSFVHFEDDPAHVYGVFHSEVRGDDPVAMARAWRAAR